MHVQLVTNSLYLFIKRIGVRVSVIDGTGLFK